MGDHFFFAAGDQMRCEACSFEFRFAQAMLDSLVKSRSGVGGRTARPATKASVDLARMIVCPACDAEGQVKRIGFKPDARLDLDPAPRSRNGDLQEPIAHAAVPGRYRRFCSRCNGFNGLHETCLHCGGTGYEPIAE